jgi:tetratricopeptide (TPR) repeat protein
MWFDRFQIAEDAPLPQAERKWVERFQELGETNDVEPAHALGLLVGLPFTDSPHVAGIRGDPVQVKGRAFVVSRDVLRRVRETTPVRLLLEDLEWADGASWEYLINVMLEADVDEHRHGIFILAAARPEWDPPAVLTQSSRYRRLDLQPLTDEATRELIAELLQRVEGVPDDVVQLIVERSEGVPYFAEEMVNWFVDRGIIDRSREPWRFVAARLRETPLPATLQHLLLTRLGSLDDRERSVLQRGAIFGRNFWAGGVAALGVRDPDVLLHPLQPRGFVEAQPESSFEGETEWSFHHGLLRDVTYESVLKRERASLHRAAAEWLEEQARRAGRLDEFAGLLGEHAERAGEMTAAADWYLRAGDRGKAQGATADARRFYDRALDLLAPVDRERRWRVLLGREEVLGILGEPDAWRADLNALLELAKDMDDSTRIAEAQIRQAEFGIRTADYRSAVRAAGDAAAAARRAGNALLEVQALARKTRAESRLGETEAASSAVGEALSRAEALGDEQTLVSTLRSAAGIYGESGHLAASLRAYRRLVEINHRLGNRAMEAGGRLNEGYTLLLLGFYKSGRAALESGLELAEAVGFRRQRAYSLQNLGLACLRSGDGRTARQILERSLGDMVAVDDGYGRAASLGYLGYVLEASGDLAGAVRRYEEAKGIFSDLGVLPSTVDCWAGLARCALAQGRLDDARQDAEGIFSYLSTHGGKGMESPIWAYQTCADIFDALNESEQARAAVEAGYRALMEQAEKIDDPDWRKSFLENVAEHRAIIDLWERMSAGRA